MYYGKNKNDRRSFGLSYEYRMALNDAHIQVGFEGDFMNLQTHRALADTLDKRFNPNMTKVGGRGVI